MSGDSAFVACRVAADRTAVRFAFDPTADADDAADRFDRVHQRAFGQFDAAGPVRKHAEQQMLFGNPPSAVSRTVGECVRYVQIAVQLLFEFCDAGFGQYAAHGVGDEFPDAVARLPVGAAELFEFASCRSHEQAEQLRARQTVGDDFAGAEIHAADLDMQRRQHLPVAYPVEDAWSADSLRLGEHLVEHGEYLRFGRSVAVAHGAVDLLPVDREVFVVDVYLPGSHGVRRWIQAMLSSCFAPVTAALAFEV